MWPPYGGRKLSTQEWMLGSFDFKHMFMPTWPFGRNARRQPPHFFGRNDWLGVITTLVLGLQHTLVMMSGIILPPLSIVPSNVSTVDDYKRYLVQAALIMSGLMTIPQVAGFHPLGRKRSFMLGAGLLSVMGVSITYLPVSQSIVTTLIAEGHTFAVAYGQVLATLCISTLTPIVLSFFPVRVLRKVFSPVVCGVTLILVGMHLCGASIKNWGGGADCAANYKQGELCTGNGDVHLPYGDPHYVGLGFLVFTSIIVIEIFGAPFMRNCAAITGVMIGYLVAAVVTVDGNRYVTSQQFDNAPAVSFLWTMTFPLNKVYWPGLLPFIIVSIVTAIESVGDTTATMQLSKMDINTAEVAMRIKGALLNDGLSGMLSALATSLPLTTYAKNNAVIMLTNVASRWAGWSCAGWLILLGILGKVAAFIVSIPNCVLGGMATLVFANIIVSGFKITLHSPGMLDRRTSFIMASSLALGIGVELVPQWGSYWLWPLSPDKQSTAVQSLHQSVMLILSTSFCVGAFVAIILNLIMPYDDESQGEDQKTDTQQGLDPSASGRSLHGPITMKLEGDPCALAHTPHQDQDVTKAPHGASTGVVGDVEMPVKPAV